MIFDEDELDEDGWPDVRSAGPKAGGVLLILWVCGGVFSEFHGGWGALILGILLANFHVGIRLELWRLLTTVYAFGAAWLQIELAVLEKPWWHVVLLIVFFGSIVYLMLNHKSLQSVLFGFMSGVSVLLVLAFV